MDYTFYPVRILAGQLGRLRGHLKHTLAYVNKFLLVHVISWKKYIEKDAEKALISKPFGGTGTLATRTSVQF